VPDYFVQLELIAVTFFANSNIHLNDHPYVIDQIHVQTLIALVFMDQIGIRAKQGMSIKTTIKAKRKQRRRSL
jgi:hypothetical protein